MAHKDDGRCRFDLAAPRHFLYPSLLLLLAEQPRHGYRLVDSLLRLGFGPVDRPSIYRSLADLEGDGLLHSWEVSPTAGSTRQVFGVTPAGLRTLGSWMDVIAEERDALEAVLKRYDSIVDEDAGGLGQSSDEVRRS
ncbi:hypothetical protein BH23ACT2_BH23ACT2_23020 [soil metagenome]